MHRLVLFDIDQTWSASVAATAPQRQALNLAFAQIHGIPNAFDEVTFAGGMDLPLMVEVYRKWGLSTGGVDDLLNLLYLSDFKAAYFDHLTRSWRLGPKG